MTIPQDLSTAIPFPEPEGKISLVVAVCRVGPNGTPKLHRKAFVIDCGGGLEREAALVQARLHQMVSVLGADIETFGWSTRRHQEEEPTSGEGSPL